MIVDLRYIAGIGHCLREEEENEMLHGKLYGAYKQASLERQLMSVPRTERRSLRVYLTGKKVK